MEKYLGNTHKDMWKLWRNITFYIDSRTWKNSELSACGLDPTVACAKNPIVWRDVRNRLFLLLFYKSWFRSSVYCTIRNIVLRRFFNYFYFLENFFWILNQNSISSTSSSMFLQNPSNILFIWCIVLQI